MLLESYSGYPGKEGIQIPVTLLFLIVLAIVFSIIGIVSDIGIKQVTGVTTSKLTDIPLTFGFVVIILLIAIIFLVIVDIIPLKKLS